MSAARFLPTPVNTTSIFVIVWSLLLLVHHVSCSNCNEDEQQDMKKQFKECSDRMLSQYKENLSKLGADEATCELIYSIIEDCTSVWDKCDTPEDIETKKELQMKTLLDQYTTASLDDCDIVNKYWETSSSFDEYEELCSKEETNLTQTAFQGCNHDIIMEVYEIQENITEVDEMAKIICDALVKMKDTCPKELEKCYQPWELKQLIKQNSEVYIKYFIDISTTKVDPGHLEDCPALVKGDYDEYYDYEEEEEEEELSAEPTSSQSVSEKKEMLREILNEHAAEQPADQPSQEPADQPSQTHKTNKAEKVKDAVNKNKPMPSNSSAVAVSWFLPLILITNLLHVVRS